MKKYNRYETMKFELDSKEKKEAALNIIADRQRKVENVKKEIENLLEDMKSKCPDEAAQMIVLELKYKAEKKILDDCIKGIKHSPFTIIADVIVQPADEPGYLEFVESTGTEVVLLKEPGTEDQIKYPENE